MLVGLIISLFFNINNLELIKKMINILANAKK